MRWVFWVDVRGAPTLRGLELLGFERSITNCKMDDDDVEDSFASSSYQDAALD